MFRAIILAALLLFSPAQANFFQEEDKQLHMQVSVPFGAMGAVLCTGNTGGFGLSGLEAILCGTAIGMIPGVVKEGLDEHEYGGWDNRDIMADAIGAFIGSLGTVTILKFSSGS